MREKFVRSSVGRRSGSRKDLLPSSAVHPAEQKLFQPDLSANENAILEGCELKDVCSLIEDEYLVEIVKSTEPSKPFAAFGSFRQRHGNGSDENRRSGVRRRGVVSGMSTEAPAKLGSGLVRQGNPSHDCLEANKIPISVELPSNVDLKRSGFPSCPIDISRDDSHVDNKVHRRAPQKLRSFSTDIDREEAWERKRDQYINEKSSYGSQRARAVARSVSDCGNRNWSRSFENGRPSTLARTLTDDDLEELRGCIDLGFGFSPDESCDLTSTLPALELYYAINRQYADIKSRSSPASPLDGVALDSTSTGGSPRSPLSDSWRISSPGDHPSQVKSRLRHWAQAVACAVKQGV